MAAKIDFRVGAGQYAPQPVLRRGMTEAQEYPMMTYPVMVTSSGWTEANLFRDVYGSHRWILRRTIGWNTKTEDYLFGPALGAAEAKSLAIDLLYRLNERATGVRKPVVIAACDDCGAKHVWSKLDGYGQERDYLPFWCWNCASHRRRFTILP